MNLGPVHVDDALDRTHQKALHLVVVFGNDHECCIKVVQPGAAGGAIEVEDRQCAATDVSYAANDWMQLGHRRQSRALQHFLDLENVDAIQLIAGQPEQQQFESVLANQLGSLID